MSAHSITSRGLAGRKIPQGTLTPIGTLLFSASEPGALYDPSDLSTLFQDAAGATPVTAVEQPVGRILDKSGRGNHATQSTTTKRPVYSRRVNLWTSTENLSSGWIPVGSTVTASGTAPTGSAAWLMSDSAVNSNHTVLQQATVAAARHTVRLLAKPQGGRYVYVQVGNGADRGNAIFDLQTATVTASSSNGLGAVSFSVSPLSDGWLLLSASAMSDAGVKSYSFGISSGPTLANVSFLGDGTRTILFSEPSLTLAADAHLPYQWVNTATDYDADTSKFPAYLRFDGVDDALQTGNINFTSTDKMTVWAGVLRASTGLAQDLLGLTSAPGDAGAFTVWGSTGGASGSSNTVTAFSSSISGALTLSIRTLAHNENAVFTGYQNAIGVNARLNSGAVQTVAAVPIQTFGNSAMHVGSRGGVSNFFNGRLYSLIVRGAQTPLSQIEATELYIKQKMRMP